jgi:hypothetical protein
LVLRFLRGSTTVAATAAPHNAYLIMAQIKTDPDASPHLSLFFVKC